MKAVTKNLVNSLLVLMFLPLGVFAVSMSSENYAVETGRFESDSASMISASSTNYQADIYYGQNWTIIYDCEDGSDNDGDGLIDYPDDPGCSSFFDDNEVNAVVRGQFIAPAVPQYVPPPFVETANVVINDDDQVTSSRFVTLNLTGSQDTETMLVSNSESFFEAEQEDYNPTKIWALEEEKGQKTVYVKFYDELGSASEVVNSNIFLNTSPVSSGAAQFIDIDGDGDLDANDSDFNLLMVNWGLSRADNPADFNNDNAVDIMDFNILMIFW